MKIKIIKASETKAKSWSGGTTTELYIYPENAILKDLNFNFRISKATVEDEKSTFTALPGVSRTLLVLEGSAILQHKGYHTAFLSKFDQDKFEGSWQTECTGILTDFNLMTTSGTEGVVEKIELQKHSQISVKPEAKMEVYYLHQGTFLFEESTLSAGDLIILQPEEDDRYRFEGKVIDPCLFIHVKIN